MRHFYTVPGVVKSKKSRYYLDPTKSNLGVERIIKPKDPVLMEKNKVIIDKHRRDAERRRSAFISRG